MTCESEIIRNALKKPEEEIPKQVSSFGKITTYYNKKITTTDTSKEGIKMFTKTCFDNMVPPKKCNTSLKISLMSKKSMILNKKFKWNISLSTTKHLPKINTNNTITDSEGDEDSSNHGRSVHRKNTRNKDFTESHNISPLESYRRSTDCNSTRFINFIDCLAMDNKNRLIKRNFFKSSDFNQKDIFKNLNKVEKALGPFNENLERLYRQSVVKDIKFNRLITSNQLLRKSLLSEKMSNKHKNFIN
jgi:hypothetical protein